MFLIPRWSADLITGFAIGLMALVQISAQSQSLALTRRGAPAKLAQPVTWGSPDQPYGKRRSVIAADRAMIQSYRLGKKPPVFSTNFSDPSELQQDWNLVSDDNQWGGFQSCRRPDSVEASSDGLRLRTLLATDCHHKWSTGYVVSKARYGFGFFEATMKIADIKGLNNAFWMNVNTHSEAIDHYEIDITEAQFPNYDHLGLQQYPAKGNTNLKYSGMGWGANFVEDLSSSFHDYGILWSPTEIIFEIDGEPIAVVTTHGAVNGPADIRFSTALIYAGIPEHPEGHDVTVQSLRIFAYQK